MSHLNRITVTGADDSVDPQRLAELARKYSMAEFGILFGNHSDVPRFPSPGWVNRLELAFADFPSRRMSAHHCGRLAHDFLCNPRRSFSRSRYCARMQVNTHGTTADVDSEAFARNLAEASRHDWQVILQLDQANDDLFEFALHERDRQAERLRHDGNFINVVGLHDRSHGAGVLPPAWPSPVANGRCGYAGGLSPDNVAAELEKIESLYAGRPDGYWIDSETRLRSEDDSVFDLEKVEAFLARATEWAGKTGSF